MSIRNAAILGIAESPAADIIHAVNRYGAEAVKKKKTLIIPLVVAAAAVAWALVYYMVKNSGSGELKLSGNIEATEVRLAFQVGGRITELLTDEGNMVKKGEVVAHIDKEELSAIREQAAASQKQAESENQLALIELKRAEELWKSNAIPKQEYDIAVSTAGVASAKVTAARHALDQAQIRLQYADLICTLDGFVLVKSAEAGEVVQMGEAVFTAADLGDVWLTAYVNETDMGRVKLGQTADVSIDSFPDKVYKGHVTFISEQAEFTPKQIQTTEERVKLVYRIKITLSNPDLELKPGMPADAVLQE